MRRYRSHVGDWLTGSLHWTWEPALLMLPWWVKIPTEDFTYVTLAIEDTYLEDVRDDDQGAFDKNRTSKLPSETCVLFICRPRTRNWSHVFFWTRPLNHFFCENLTQLNSDFGKLRTSAFTWYTLDTSDMIFNLRKMRLRLHSFGPVWTISTENQWEISEVCRFS